jgi:hypothetical protein
MNVTPEHEDIQKEYNAMRGVGEDKVLLAFPVDTSKPMSHGDILKVPVFAYLKDGGCHNLAFPDEAEICVNLWGTDEQTADVLKWFTGVWHPELVLETGTNKGRSTLAIAQAMEKTGKGHIFTVDMADHEVATRTPRTTFVHGRLPDVLTSDPDLFGMEGIDMAYLDASHTEEAIAIEVEFVLQRKSARGVYILFDDACSTSWPGVGEYLKSRNAFILPTPHGLGILYEGPDNGQEDGRHHNEGEANEAIIPGASYTDVGPEKKDLEVTWSTGRDLHGGRRPDIEVLNECALERSHTVKL